MTEAVATTARSSSVSAGQIRTEPYSFRFTHKITGTSFSSTNTTYPGPTTFRASSSSQTTEAQVTLTNSFTKSGESSSGFTNLEVALLSSTVILSLLLTVVLTLIVLKYRSRLTTCLTSRRSKSESNNTHIQTSVSKSTNNEEFLKSIDNSSLYAEPLEKGATVESEIYETPEQTAKSRSSQSNAKPDTCFQEKKTVFDKKLHSNTDYLSVNSPSRKKPEDTYIDMKPPGTESQEDYEDMLNCKASTIYENSL